MESDETFIQKTFELINQLNGHISLISIKVVYLSVTRQINVSRAINDIQNKGFPLTNCHMFYFDSYKQLYVHLGEYPFKNQILLKFQLFLQTTIKIRFRKISSPNAKSQKEISLNKNTKSTRKQKTINEVVQIVRNWRFLFDQVDYHGKKVYTLDQAAHKLGMQRKTLDDYYYKLKNAQAYGFDIQKNKYQKIGILRKFVKDCVKKNKQKKPTTSSVISTPQKTPEDDISKYIADEAGCSSDSDSSF